MNNGKVRIYDLSKELNLDNKELLAICDQLNIAVKSHSSTISETEAERIRSAAEKQVASATPLRKEMSVTSPKSNLPNNTGARPKPNPPHKQQILEIRKPKAPERANLNPVEPQALNSPQPPAASAAPRPYSSPASPIKPTLAQTKPVRSTPSEARQDTEDASNRPLNQEREMLVRAPQDVDQQAPLSGPPVRPVKEKTIQMPNLSQAERPVLKRDQVNQPRTKPPETTSSGDAPERPDRRVPGVTRPEQGSRTQPVVELNRPRPARPNEPISAIAGRSRSSGVETVDPNGGEDSDGVATLLSPDELLRRPTLPRPVKGGGGKKWQEEEIDEGQDSAGKAGKAGAKVKRLKPLVELDDEEDLG